MRKILDWFQKLIRFLFLRTKEEEKEEPRPNEYNDEHEHAQLEEKYKNYLESVAHDPYWEDGYWSNPMYLIELAYYVRDGLARTPNNPSWVIEDLMRTTKASVKSAEHLFEAAVHIICPEFLDDVYPKDRDRHALET